MVATWGVRFGGPCPPLRRKTGTAMNFRRRLPEIRWLYPVCPTGYAHSQRVSPERVNTRRSLPGQTVTRPAATVESVTTRTRLLSALSMVVLGFLLVARWAVSGDSMHFDAALRNAIHGWAWLPLTRGMVAV